jgi:large subunit ribosomal protein L23
MSFIDKFKKKDNAKSTAKAEPVKKVKAEVATEKKEKAVEVVSTKKVGKTGLAYKILLSPLVSEKAAVSESLNTYTFKVDPKATKIEIKKAVKQVYGVEPKNVRIINVNAKWVRRGNTYGRRRDWKKAMVTLKKGESINIHEGV